MCLPAQIHGFCYVTQRSRPPKNSYQKEIAASVHLPLFTFLNYTRPQALRLVLWAVSQNELGGGGSGGTSVTIFDQWGHTRSLASLFTNASWPEICFHMQL